MSTTPESSKGPQVKEKRSRKRQRLSCVECTKRRQKCDREYPCGLCVTRGIPHLCHWASGPVSRPVPARPPTNLPDAHGNPLELSATIKALSERLASLERTIADQKSSTSVTFLSEQHYSPVGDTSSSTSNSYANDLPSKNSVDDVDEDPSPPAPLQRDVHEAAVTLAQLSLAHHGEYVGSGTILCALHRLGNSANMFLPYARSTESTTSAENQPSTSELNSVQLLAIHGLPPRALTDTLILTFFAECNWRFGIPEKWFRAAYSRMWRALDALGTYVGPCAEQVNSNWLSLLFAMLALVPQNTVETQARTREAFFMSALAARRLSEDAFLISPSFLNNSAADGTVLGCFATVLMSTYLAARGRVSEAWKLVGSALRAGQAAGMHRDPGWVKWKVMSEHERLLRRRGWWKLVVCDQLYSSVLGRPAMVDGEMMDVPHPSPKYSEEAEDNFDKYQATLVKLCQIVCKAGLKCTGLKSPPYATVMEMDCQYEEWLNNLPEEYRWHSGPQSTPETSAERALHCQRHNLSVWYLACRMNLHRPWLTRATPPVLPLPAALVGVESVVLNPSREKSIALAIDLIHVQSADTLWASEDSEFSHAFFVFDGAVTLISALAYAPDHPSAKRCIETVDLAMENLRKVGQLHGHSEIAHRAVEVLEVLRKVEGWTGNNADEQRFGATKRNVIRCGSTEDSQNLSSEGAYMNSQSQPNIQPAYHTSIPFLTNMAHSSFSPSSNMFSRASQPTVPPPVHRAARNEDLGEATDREGIWINSSEFGWSGNITQSKDVHMMMPFEILQGMSVGVGQWEGGG